MLREATEIMTDAGALRGAVARAYEVLRERDREAQQRLITTHVRELLAALPFVRAT